MVYVNLVLSAPCVTILIIGSFARPGGQTRAIKFQRLL
jgi:hypothetical protein